MKSHKKKRIVSIFKLSAFLTAVILLTGCDKNSEPVDLRTDVRLVQQGKTLFAKHCSSCHGATGEGDSNWRQPDKDGFWPAPPLNGSAHTWHHPQQWLINKIKFGGQVGKSKMPAWKDKLTEQEVLSVLAYIQSLWPEQTYQTWTGINQR